MGSFDWTAHGDTHIRHGDVHISCSQQMIKSKDLPGDPAIAATGQKQFGLIIRFQMQEKMNKT